MTTPLFLDVDSALTPFTDAGPLYPAFESGMGDTLVREVDDQADPDALWLRAVRLQMVLDRIEGRA